MKKLKWKKRSNSSGGFNISADIDDNRSFLIVEDFHYTLHMEDHGDYVKLCSHPKKSVLKEKAQRILEILNGESL